MKAIENFFPAFAYPDINTRGVGRILPTPLVFISGYANMENVFYCLNVLRLVLQIVYPLIHISFFSFLLCKLFLLLTMSARNSKEPYEVSNVNALVTNLGRQQIKSLPMVI